MSDYCLHPNQCGLGMDCSPCYQKRISTLESQLAATQQRLAECERDAGRYRLIRDHVAPIHLVQNDFPNFGDIPDSESISERIDRMVDAVIDEAMGRG